MLKCEKTFLKLENPVLERTWAYLSTTPSPIFRSVPAVQLSPSCCCDSTMRSSTLALSQWCCHCPSSLTCSVDNGARDRPPPGSCNRSLGPTAVAIVAITAAVGPDCGGCVIDSGCRSPCCCWAHLAILDRPCRTVTAMALSAHMDTTVATSIASVAVAVTTVAATRSIEPATSHTRPLSVGLGAVSERGQHSYTISTTSVTVGCDHVWLVTTFRVGISRVSRNLRTFTTWRGNVRTGLVPSSD